MDSVTSSKVEFLSANPVGAVDLVEVMDDGAVGNSEGRAKIVNVWSMDPRPMRKRQPSGELGSVGTPEGGNEAPSSNGMLLFAPLLMLTISDTHAKAQAEGIILFNSLTLLQIKLPPPMGL